MATGKLHKFSGKTCKSNSYTHTATSKSAPRGGLSYKALCGVVITTYGDGIDKTTCPRCILIGRREGI